MVSVVLLDVKNEETLINRLEKRALIEGRADDAKRDILHKRLEVYKQQTADVLTAYPVDKQIHINGDQPPLHVFKDLLTALLDKNVL